MDQEKSAAGDMFKPSGGINQTEMMVEINKIQNTSVVIQNNDENA